MVKDPIIAVAAIEYYDQIKNNNLLKIKEYIQKAKKKKADIICFPESCISRHGSLEENHRYIQEITEECKKNSIWCIINEDIQRGKKIYNSSLLIDRNTKDKNKR